MTEKQTAILCVLDKALRLFNQREGFLIKNDLGERCICSRFAMYLEYMLRDSCFSDYTTDVEYNRGMGGNSRGKKMLFGHDMTIDLVVHKRAFDPEIGFDNLFAVEMKKQGLSFYDDKRRLQVLVDNSYGFGYRAGFAIIIVNDESNSICELCIDEMFFNEEDF